MSIEEDSLSGISGILKENDFETVYNSWKKLERGFIAPSTNVALRTPIKWNTRRWIKKNYKGKLRHCHTVTRPSYRVGLTPRILRPPPCYLLAFLSKVHQYKLSGRLDRSQKITQQIANGGKLCITHTCGNGPGRNKMPGDICVNPNHMTLRTYQYNYEQRRCHEALEACTTEAERQEFFDSKKCTHFPKCF